jgi:predicted protein tyrosine phosphatase
MMDQVYEQIYVGDIDTLRRQDAVRQEGIDAVVRLDLRDRDVLHWDSRFDVLDMPINDGATVPDGVFDHVTDFIHEQIQNEKTVLVHCNQGISRSTTMVIAYLIKYEGMSLGEAFGTVREGREIARPHGALMASLIDYYDLPYTPQQAYSPQFLTKLLHDA